jgi:hypothetical protein
LHHNLNHFCTLRGNWLYLLNRCNQRQITQSDHPGIHVQGLLLFLAPKALLIAHGLVLNAGSHGGASDALIANYRAILNRDDGIAPTGLP